MFGQNFNMHERPDNVIGQWVKVPPEERTFLQRTAHKTNGWGTIANVGDIAALGIGFSGYNDFRQGHYLRGLLKVLGSRLFDIADGAIAEKTRTKGGPGALIDTAGDKVMGAVGTGLLVRTGDMSPLVAAGLISQQARIFLENVEIKRSGGKPTSNLPGKLAMFALSGAIILPMAAKAAEHAEHTGLATLARWSGHVSAFSSILLAQRAIHDYQLQSQELHLAQITPTE